VRVLFSFVISFGLILPHFVSARECPLALVQEVDQTDLEFKDRSLGFIAANNVVMLGAAEALRISMGASVNWWRFGVNTSMDFIETLTHHMTATGHIPKANGRVGAVLERLHVEKQLQKLRGFLNGRHWYLKRSIVNTLWATGLNSSFFQVAALVEGTSLGLSDVGILAGVNAAYYFVTPGIKVLLFRVIPEKMDASFFVKLSNEHNGVLSSLQEMVRARAQELQITEHEVEEVMVSVLEAMSLKIPYEQRLQGTSLLEDSALAEFVRRADQISLELSEARGRLAQEMAREPDLREPLAHEADHVESSLVRQIQAKGEDPELWVRRDKELRKDFRSVLEKRRKLEKLRAKIILRLLHLQDAGVEAGSEQVQSTLYLGEPLSPELSMALHRALRERHRKHSLYLGASGFLDQVNAVFIFGGLVARGLMDHMLDP